ncbi:MULTISPECIES: DUF1450 domain-containing protein [unclassified Paenibacillus]|uniref:DUF1450 domain-containing protein n=1 Tax=unclassified Paenibacillus TaxID=185978 RepID=UPI001C10EB43|nr:MULTISPECIES: DUF1450 domain-containing protein [unclassified Paenibacillus]MBU5443696.1 YuzB family protein [Paenibacillus sp. MSJ-34]CAH0117642.1 hypothetical protein PAE9249_00102 [Paenibacillus sp. CECT 9249]
MANDIRICDKCKHIKMKSILPKLKQLAPDAEIKIGCKSYCGPCNKRVFIFINGRYVTAPTEDEAIEKASQYVKQ